MPEQLNVVVFVEFTARGFPVVIIDKIKKPIAWKELVRDGKIYSLREDAELRSIIKRELLLPVMEVYTRDEKIRDPKENPQ
jgi:hypothetical protein